MFNLCADAAEAVDTYTFNFMNLKKGVPDALRERRRLKPEQRRLVVSHIYDRMKAAGKSKLKKEDMEEVAKMFVRKYENAFSDGLCGLLDGFAEKDIVRMLIDKRDNDCRLGKRIFMDGDHDGSDRVKKKPKDAYGCVGWQPDLPEITGDIDQKIAFLHHIATQKEEDEWPHDEVEQAIRDTYPFQRHDVNSKMTMALCRQKWPILLTCSGLRAHFNHLVGFDVKERLSEQFHERIPKILHFFQEIPKKNSVQMHLLQEISHRKGADKEVQLRGTMLLIMDELNEDSSQLFFVKKVCSTLYTLYTEEIPITKCYDSYCQEPVGSDFVKDDYPVHPCIVAFCKYA